MMDCCYVNECMNYSVTPVLLSPCPSMKCCESAPVYIPCCNEKQVLFCCEKPPPRTPQANKVCCDDDQGHYKCQRRQEPQQSVCPTCHQPTCPPVKPPVKYVMPCYRYEDGRIEQYVPKVHGRLPTTAYKRNGVQDQVVGYRGAMRYLCAVEKKNNYYVYTSIDPIKKIYPRITQEVYPVKPMRNRT